MNGKAMKRKVVPDLIRPAAKTFTKHINQKPKIITLIFYFV